MKPITLALAIAGSLISGLHSAPIPLNLPRPDGQPGNPAKPVKVYILAGQSNMVGMGDISGAGPAYPSIYLSSDPSIIQGRLQVGLERHPRPADPWCLSIERCFGASRCRGGHPQGCL